MTLDLGTPVASAACATLLDGWNKAQPLGTELPGPLGQQTPTGTQVTSTTTRTDPCTQIQLMGRYSLSKSGDFTAGLSVDQLSTPQV